MKQNCLPSFMYVVAMFDQGTHRLDWLTIDKPAVVFSKEVRNKKYSLPSTITCVVLPSIVRTSLQGRNGKG